jgi:polysaccharide deacetylase 2 family uncharacterized protein YibQ
VEFMSSKKKQGRAAAKNKRPLQGHGLKLAIIILVSGSLTLAGLIIYFSLQIQTPPPSPSPKSPIEKIRISTFDDINRLVENELLASRYSSGWQRLESTADLVRLKMDDDYPESLRLMELATRIALTDSPAQLDLAPRKGLVRIYWQGELRMELRYRVSERLHRQRPKVAIIMDDMGRDLSDFSDLLDLSLSITPAILPQTSFATRGAKLLTEKDYEYMIHLPMEPKKYPAISPGPEALLLSLSATELKQRVQRYIQRVPGAVGGNNHMGSGFTGNRPAMHSVLKELKAAGLFFIDSRTIGGSVAFDEARRMGMRTAQRNIFLDNEENVGYISRQIRKMVKIAEEKGAVIAICHPYPQTFEALRRDQAWLREQKVDFVLASRLVKSY